MIIPSQTKPTTAGIVSCDIVPTISLSQVLAELPRWIDSLTSPGHVEMIIKPSQPSAEAQRIAELVGDQAIGDDIGTTTDHAWLVVLGYFAQALGLISKLEGVPINQKAGTLDKEGEDGQKQKSEAQTKLIEFLVGILGGIEYLQDLNRSENPIATDPTVAEAWAQALFAHYSGVSRTLDASDEGTLGAVVEVLRDVSRPFIEAAVMESIKRKGRLTVDVDLTGREVSPTSTSYEGASFGWMDGEICKGYQAAIASLVCERWTRLLLVLQRYSGRTHSAECLQAVVEELEQVLGVRPRRRVELVQAGRDELLKCMQTVQMAIEGSQQAENKQWKQVAQAKTEIATLKDQVQALEAAYAAEGRVEKPHSQLAKTRRQLAGAQKRAQRAGRALSKAQRQRNKHQAHWDQLHGELMILDERLARLQTDNQANPNPVAMVMRIDAGFSTGLNLTWLIEMGYTILTKAHHGSIADSLRRHVTAQAAWTRVGRNAEALNMGAYYQHDCPYPLQSMLVRYRLPASLRYTALLYYGDQPPPPLPAWFASYNARQTLEAGIKEEKSVFTLKRHLVRSVVGMQLQEQFALFAANLTRWAADWIKTMLRQAHHNFTLALDQVKTLTRVVSRARARWVRNALGHTLSLDENGPFAGTVLCLSGQVAIQRVLHLFNFVPS
jgi:hypothetical protein